MWDLHSDGVMAHLRGFTDRRYEVGKLREDMISPLLITSKEVKNNLLASLRSYSFHCL
jgi:hypothetical protein